MNANNKTILETIPSLETQTGPFPRGARYRAIVETVRDCGVSVRPPLGQGNAMVSTRCWGKGAARAKALSVLKPGDELTVLVKVHDPAAMTLSLVLAGCEHLLGSAPKAASHPVAEKAVASKAKHKPEYHPFERGTTLFVDTANLLGKIGPDHAAFRLQTLRDSLNAAGYEVHFFLENRAFLWASFHQGNDDERAAFQTFVYGGDVTLFDKESDQALLQAACAIPTSVVISCDRFRDYAGTYSDLVGSERHREFREVAAAGRLLILVDGVKDAIDVTSPEKESGDSVSIVPSDEDSEEDCPAVACPRRGGVLGIADACLEHGNAERAILLYGRVARKRPEFYREIADVYSDGTGVPVDSKKAAHYYELAERRERDVRESRHRRHRLAVIRRREGRPFRRAA